MGGGRRGEGPDFALQDPHPGDVIPMSLLHRDVDAGPDLLRDVVEEASEVWLDWLRPREQGSGEVRVDAPHHLPYGLAQHPIGIPGTQSRESTLVRPPYGFPDLESLALCLVQHAWLGIPGWNSAVP